MISAPSEEPHISTSVQPDARGAGYEWKSRARLLRVPLVCVSCGFDERGKARTAKGIVAIGRYAVGVVAIGQFAVGIVAVGQVAGGVFAFGQFAAAFLGAFGQFAVGTFAVGQFVAGLYARGQIGWARYLWSPGRTDMEAVAMFETIKWFVQQDAATVWNNIKFVVGLAFEKIMSLFD